MCELLQWCFASESDNYWSRKSDIGVDETDEDGDLSTKAVACTGSEKSM